MESHRFSKKTWKEDIVFVVEEKKLYLSKAILATVSPVFDRMFEADFKEKEMIEIPLPDKKYSDVEEFLLCIYPDCHKDVTEENVDKVLPLSNEYQVDVLQKRCETFIVKSTNFETTTKTLIKRLSEAILYNLNDLKARCIDVLADRKLSETKEEMICFEIPTEIQNQVLFTTGKKLELKNQDYRYAIVESFGIPWRGGTESLLSNIRKTRCQENTKSEKELIKKLSPSDFTPQALSDIDGFKYMASNMKDNILKRIEKKVLKA